VFYMEIEWTVLPRGDVAAHWSGLNVTLNRLGSIAIGRNEESGFGLCPSICGKAVLFHGFTEISMRLRRRLRENGGIAAR
jgi:hypothetical protein